jgi:hypothetical protein
MNNVVELTSPGLTAVKLPNKVSYEEAFKIVSTHIIDTQVGVLDSTVNDFTVTGHGLKLSFTDVPKSAKILLRTPFDVIVEVSQKAAVFAVEVLTFNWMSWKFASNGNDELGQRASDEYKRRMRLLYQGGSGLTKHDVEMVVRYLD